MKKILLFFTIIIVIICTIDILFGVASKYYVKNYRLPGDYELIDYLMKDSNDSIIILGNSVASNSLIPSIIEDSLRTTCFNGGANAQRMIYYRTMLDCILKRHTPKMIVLGIGPDALHEDEMGRYEVLSPYYHTGYTIIDSCLESKSTHEKIFFKSNLYRYNTIWFRLLLYNFITPNERGHKGFIAMSQPLYPTKMKILEGTDSVSSIRLNDFKYIVNTCKQNNIKLIIYFPPSFIHYKKTSATIQIINKICKENNIPVYNDSHDTYFQQHNEWFHDNVHLAKEGAIVYSKLFISRIKNSLMEE